MTNSHRKSPLEGPTSMSHRDYSPRVTSHFSNSFASTITLGTIQTLPQE